MRDEFQLEWRDEAGQLRRIVVPRGATLLGRDPNCGLSLPQSKVSWHHAELSWRGDDLYICDLDASNGTFLNGKRLEARVSTMLHSDDVLRLGDVELRYSPAGQYSGAARTEMLRLDRAAPGRRFIVGRSPQADICLPSPDVSWQHAALTRQQNGWRIEDLGSANGTSVNGARISSSSLAPDDRIQVGLARLKLDTDQIAYTDEAGQVQLEAVGLSREVSQSGSTLALLQDVSLCVRPRELVAIVGASGAGKTTLLKALNGYAPATRGRVLLNGLDLYGHLDLFRTTIGYVPQEEIVHGELSVESALRYTARLRLPPDTTDYEISVLIVRVLDELGLSHRRQHRISDLSGGERKRVNIGVELLTRPSVLFLDEPTTGLDAGLERRITSLLRDLANEGRTVVAVTHSITTLDEYDKVAFLSCSGHLAFFGAPQEALGFFEARDFIGVYDLLGDDARSPGFWARRFRARFGGGSAAVSSSSVAPAPPHRAPLAQLGALLGRYLEVIRGDTRNLWFWLAQAPFIAVLIALLFDANIFASPQVKSAKGDWPVADAPHLLFLMAFSMICFGLVNAAREIVKEKAIYERERHVGLQIGPYLWSKVLVLGGVALAQCVLLMLIVAAKIGFGDASTQAAVLLLLFLGALNAVLLGLLVSALASSPDQAITLVAALLLVQVPFSGLVPLDKLPDGLNWLSALSATRWSYGGLCGLMDVPQRWEEVGLGPWIDEVHRTSARQAAQVLTILAVVSLGAVWGVLTWRGQRRV